MVKEEEERRETEKREKMIKNLNRGIGVVADSDQGDETVLANLRMQAELRKALFERQQQNQAERRAKAANDRGG